MPWQIHWIVGNADLRFCVLCPKIYRSQQIGHLHIVGHYQSEGLRGCHALKTSPSAARQLCWHCSGPVEYIEWRSSSSRSFPLPGGQLPLAWRCLWHTSAMGKRCGCRCDRCCSILLWNWVQVSHWQTTSSMALLMPGQKKLPCASNCNFVIPWWNWCRTLSLLAGGMTSASPHRTRLSLTVSISLCCQYRWRGQGTSLMSSGQPVMIRLVRAHISGLLTKAYWKASLQVGVMWAWLMATSSERSGPELRQCVWYDHFLAGQ